MSNTDTITAYKGNLTQTFTRKSWDILGSDKYGWTLIPEPPKEIAALVSSAQDDAGDSLQEAPKEQSAGVPKQTRKSKKRR